VGRCVYCNRNFIYSQPRAGWASNWLMRFVAILTKSMPILCAISAVLKLRS